MIIMIIIVMIISGKQKSTMEVMIIMIIMIVITISMKIMTIICKGNRRLRAYEDSLLIIALIICYPLRILSIMNYEGE